MAAHAALPNPPRDALVGESAGAYPPVIQVYTGSAGDRFATVVIHGLGGSHQINLDREQVQEVAAALSRAADLLPSSEVSA